MKMSVARFFVGGWFALIASMLWIAARSVWWHICLHFERLTSAAWWAWLGGEAVYHLQWFGILWLVIGILCMVCRLNLKPTIKVKGDQELIRQFIQGRPKLYW